jgi:hypothetical protein
LFALTDKHDYLAQVLFQAEVELHEQFCLNKWKGWRRRDGKCADTASGADGSQALKGIIQYAPAQKKKKKKVNRLWSLYLIFSLEDMASDNMARFLKMRPNTI